MDLELLGAELRPRSGWQGADMGLRMLRRWAKVVFSSWFLITLPLLVVACILSQIIAPAAGFLTLWWAKPLLERFPVYVLGHTLFGAQPRAREVAASSLSIISPNFFQALLMDKFNLFRANKTPVLVLENLRGNARQKRLIQMSRVASHDVSLWISIALMLVELGIVVGLGMTAVFLIPEPYASSWFNENYLIDDNTKGLLLTLAYYVAISITCPMNGAMGFSGYINRRTHVEGWDIEISLRNIKRRNQSASSLFTALFSLLVMGSVLTPSTSHAGSKDEVRRAPECQDRRALLEHLRKNDAPTPKLNAEARQQLADVLETDEFAICRLEQRYDWDWDNDPEAKPSTPSATGFGGLLNIIMIILAVGVVSYFVYLMLGQRGFTRKQLTNKPDTLFGLDVTPESLPDDVPAQALQLWEKGDKRQALGLLYRAALADLIHRHHTPLDSSLTENEVLQRSAVVPAIPSMQGYLQSLTGAWQTVAYAHRDPSISFVVLCKEWSDHFQ